MLIMIILKLLLSSIIYIAALEIANPVDEKWEVLRHNAFNYDLSDYMQPLHYEMQMKLFHNYSSGNFEITIRINIATQNITFHTPSMMVITNPQLKHINTKVVYFLKPMYMFNLLYYINVLNCKYMLLPGIYILNMNFLDKNQFFEYNTNKDGTEEWYLASGLQPKKLPMFPSWGKPETRATFNISIMHDREYTALSNMPIRATEPVMYNEKMIWTYFHQIPLMSIDSVSFMVFSLQRNLNSTVNVWCKPQLASQIILAQSIIEKITVYLDNYWNNSKSILERTVIPAKRKVDHIVVPIDKAKSTLGFVFYKELDITYNEEKHPIARKMIIARLIACEMAQKYIGNLLSSTHWFNQWLNEGFTKFLQGYYIIEKAMPEFRMMDLFVVQVQHELLDLNSYIVIDSVMEYDNYIIYPENVLFPLSYVKGSIIWRMLERTLPPDVLSIGIDKYLNDQFSNSKARTSDHLWTVMQTVMKTLNPKNHFDIKEMVNSWATQRSFLVVEVRRNYYSPDVVTALVQFHNALDAKQYYYLPLTYTTESNLNFNVTWSDVCLTPSYSKFVFSLKKDEWVIFNIQQAGYYRVNYDSGNWRRIVQYLNSEKYRNIHVLNRAQLINDAFHFAVHRKLNFSIFWDLTKYLSKETDYIAWYPMLKIFEFISSSFAFSEFDEFKTKVEEMVNPLVNVTWHKLYYTNIPMFDDDHTICLMQELAKWSCIIDSRLCLTIANKRLQYHLTNPEQNKLLPEWKRWTYCNGLKIADIDTSNEFVDKLYYNYYKGKNYDYTILECLAYSPNPEVIIHYLEETLPNVAPTFARINFEHDIKPVYFSGKLPKYSYALTANIFLFTFTKSTKYMLEDILKNFRKLKDGKESHYLHVSDIAALTVIINNIYSKKQFNEIRKFVRDNFVKRRLLIYAVEHKINTRSLEIDRQIKYFQSLFSPLEI
ncbi:aminopeptidase A-like [Cataglyphis hispanica]|uniref:aminopeptidase A-like n=1 Tax=Cataglyphis hispanica TaxID=1086592 RepID=UPI00218003E2|nr:aminopeptidase A-like [Cataglyphis hispanica]